MILIHNPPINLDNFLQPAIIMQYEDYDYAPTGDPMRDREFDNGGAGGGDHFDSYIPEPVKKFLLDLRDHISAGNVFETSNLYENTYPKLTEEFFKSSAWPEADTVEQYVGGDDSLFLILYRELYYRHIYARVQGGPSIEERFESYYNYCNLFNYILSSESPVKLVLPDQWQWEIIDEFIYQFQSFQQYRAKVQKKTEDELDVLKHNPRVWDVLQGRVIIFYMNDSRQAADLILLSPSSPQRPPFHGGQIEYQPTAGGLQRGWKS